MTDTLNIRRTDGAPLDRLAAGLTGRLLLPGEPDYEARALPWNVAVPSSPAAVVEVADAADVATVIRFAAEHGLEVDVRATGHGAARVSERTLLVHTGRLDEVTVHQDGWARVGAGVVWSQVIEAAAPYGLAPLCGSSPGVGVVGLITGGGLGPMARTFGHASDHVRSFEVVTGDGVVRRASAEENPALFWGLRGGKGTLGIVTAVELDLPSLPEFLGGCVYFGGADVAPVARAWRAWADTLPEEATTSLAILRLPDAPFVPAPLAGRCTVAVRFAWVGSSTDGAAVFAPMAQVAEPVFGGVAVMPYTQVGMIHADPVEPMPVLETVELLDDLSEAALDTLLELAGPEADCPQMIVEVRRLGGALSREPEHPSAVCHRSAGYSLLTIGIGVPPLLELTAAHADRLADRMRDWTNGGALPNFGGNTTAAAVARNFDAETLSRLSSLATAYDPAGVLAAGRAIRVAG